MNVIAKKIRKGAHSFFIEQEGITGLSLPIILGVIVFFAIKYFNGSNSLFWALAAWYWLLGAFISYKKPRENATTKPSCIFERINQGITGIIIIAFTIALFFDWEIVWPPALIVSIIIFYSALFGIKFKKRSYGVGYDFGQKILEKVKTKIIPLWKKTESARTKSIMVVCAVFVIILFCFSSISEFMITINGFIRSKLRINLLADAILPAAFGLIGFGIFFLAKSSIITCLFWGIVFSHWTLLGSLDFETDKFEEKNIVIGLAFVALGILIGIFTKNIPFVGLIIYGLVLSCWSLSKVGIKDID